MTWDNFWMGAICVFMLAFSVAVVASALIT